MKKKLAVVFGTRPEIVKLFPVINELSKNKNFDVASIHSGQHSLASINPFLSAFNLKLNYHNIPFISGNSLVQSLTYLTENLGNILSDIKPDLTIVQGDTATALAGASASFYSKIPVCHIEAGLRTYDYNNPYPEEMNRVLISKLAKIHFCPTQRNKADLLNEGIQDKIYVVGNTVIDSLIYAIAHLKETEPRKDIEEIEKSGKNIVLLTLHRREIIGKKLENLLKTILDMTKTYKDFLWVCPVHFNPNVANSVVDILSGNNIRLIEPCGYFDFIRLLIKSKIVLSDSGGISEESTALKKNFIILRDVTERPEALCRGTLAGTECKGLKKIFAKKILKDETDIKNIDTTFGDGKSAEKIAKILHQIL